MGLYQILSINVPVVPRCLHFGPFCAPVHTSIPHHIIHYSACVHISAYALHTYVGNLLLALTLIMISLSYFLENMLKFYYQIIGL